MYIIYKIMSVDKVKGQADIRLYAGKATVAPPVGSSLGQYGLNLNDVVKEFNGKTNHLSQEAIVPIRVKAFQNKTFEIIFKKAPLTFLIKRMLKHSSNKKYITYLDLWKIVLIKSQFNQEIVLKQNLNSILGTLKSMKVNVIK